MKPFQRAIPFNKHSIQHWEVKSLQLDKYCLRYCKFQYCCNNNNNEFHHLVHNFCNISRIETKTLALEQALQTNASTMFNCTKRTYHRCDIETGTKWSSVNAIAVIMAPCTVQARSIQYYLVHLITVLGTKGSDMIYTVQVLDVCTSYCVYPSQWKFHLVSGYSSKWIIPPVILHETTQCTVEVFDALQNVPRTSLLD